jgi:hypothetical protein
MHGLRKVPQVMFKPTEMRQPLCFLSLYFFCLFSGSILSLSFSFFCFCFFLTKPKEKNKEAALTRFVALNRFDVTEGEK